MRTYGRVLPVRIGRGDERRLDDLARRRNEQMATVLRDVIAAGLEAVENNEPERISRARILTRLDAIELLATNSFKALARHVGATPEDVHAELEEIAQIVRERSERRQRDEALARSAPRLAEARRQGGK